MTIGMPRLGLGRAILHWLRTPAPILLLQALAAILLVLRAVFVFGAEPFFEEAYYWLWGQHPALSYVDHPPLNAWLLGLSSLLFGWNLFALRLVGWLSLAGTIWLLWLWSRRLAGANWRHWFWSSVVIYLAAPITSLFTAVVFPDHLLVPLCLGTAYAAARFIEDRESGRTSYRWLWVAALLLGLAGLTKYNAVLLAIAIFGYLLTTRHRALFRDWHLYAAVGLVLVVVSPVAVWNAANGFPSVQFHLVERQTDVMGTTDINNLKAMALLALLSLSPLLFGPLVRLLAGRWQGPFAAAGHGIAVWAFLLSTTLFLGASLFTGLFPHWNIVAYIVAFAFLPRYVAAGWHVVSHAVYGIIVAALFTVIYVLTPVSGLPGNVQGVAAANYGWAEIGRTVEEAVAAHEPDLIATSGIASAAQLGFAIGRTDVVPLAGRTNQYRLWFDPAAHLGETAVILARPDATIEPDVASRFESVSRIGDVTIVRFGATLSRHGIWLGRGFKG